MDREQERAFIDGLIRRVAEECPRRRATSHSERRGQQIVRGALDAEGLSTHLHEFEFNDSVHENFVLHFGLGTLGTLISGVAPRTAFALHAGSAASYWADSTRRAYVLRRLLGFKPSQNLIGVLPADAEPSLRIVFVAHIDAAFTGMAFDRRVISVVSKRRPYLGFLERPIAFAIRAQAALAGIDLVRSVIGPLAWPLRPLEILLTVPSAMIFLFNLEILIRDQMVEGANDDLTGVACLPVLARRLADKPADVELVFVASGAEETSLGGADALARDMEGTWDKRNTVIVALDTLSLGELLFIETEGEVVRTPIPRWLRDVVMDVAEADDRFSSMHGFEPPLGGTDAAAFLARGWDAVALTCIDPTLGTAGNYHQTSDTPDSLDLDQVLLAVDFAELLARRLIEQRVRPKPPIS